MGEPHYTEAMLPRGYKTVIDWFQEVAADSDYYANPELVRLDDDDDDSEAEIEAQEPGIDFSQAKEDE